MRAPYCTPDGQAVTHASQPRQRSKCWTTVGPSVMLPPTRPAIRWMRPRGESISSPHRFQVGHVGRQKPQWTHLSMSGVSGAGRKAELDYLFCECNESVRAYGVPKHRHLSEIEEQLALAAGGPVTIQFTPHLIPVSRGIHTTLYLSPVKHFSTAEEAAALHAQIAACYQAAYANEPFVRVLDGKALPDTKNVVGTNTLELAWRLDARTGRLLVMSAEDNIVKGASGQAVQSFNIMCGYAETAGLL